MTKGSKMQKKNILIPMAVCAMLLPMTANACPGKGGCTTGTTDCSVNCCEIFCFDSAYCCENDRWYAGDYCFDSDQVIATPKPTATPTAAPTATPTVAPTKTPATDSGNSGTVSNSAGAQVLNLVNEYRQQNGLNSLKRSAELDRAAEIRANELAEVFSHTRPDGSSWSTVSSLAYGENIAMGYSNADKVMAAWMNSSGHRQNILNSSYGSIGIAGVNINGTMYWVQLFGK